MKNDEKRAKLEIVFLNTDEEVIILEVEEIMVIEDILEEDEKSKIKSSTTSVKNWDTRHMSSQKNFIPYVRNKPEIGE